MELKRKLCIAVAVFVIVIELVSGNFVLKVQHKFPGKKKLLKEFKSHDRRHHSRMLASVDFPLGGDSRVDSVGLYYTVIKLGSPPKEYHVQVDTGSDILWVSCVPCTKCPSKTNLGFPLLLYDKKSSSTSKKVGCEDDFCSLISESGSCQPDIGCTYHIVYADESTSDGSFIRDRLTLEQITGDLQTGPLGQEIVFGCGSDQSEQLKNPDSALDGVMGFGQSNTSVLSQLAAAGNAKRVFSHCLDNVKGGGIFAVGVVDSPKVKTTPMDLISAMHYNILLKGMDVDGAPLDLPPSIVKNGGTIVDSGTTLAYFPKPLYDSLLEMILARQPVKLHIVEKTFQCFSFTKDVDEAFPPVNFHFEDSLTLIMHPHDYLVSLEEDVYCFGWQVGGMKTDQSSEVILLGDLILQNKLVVYDLDNEVIGWADHNCSSSIKVKDRKGVCLLSRSRQSLISSSPVINRKASNNFVHIDRSGFNFIRIAQKEIKIIRSNVHCIGDGYRKKINI